MAHNISYKALVWSRVKVIEEVAKDPNSLSDALFQNGIIAQGIRDEIQLDCIGDTQKARILATCLEDIIKVFPHRYEDIIEILRENFGDLVVTLKNKEEEILAEAQFEQSQATIISNESEQDEDLCIRLSCGCGHCDIKNSMQGDDCSCTASIQLSLCKQDSEIIGKTEMAYSAYKVALQCQTAHMHASYKSLISNTVNELKKKHALPVITQRLKALLTPQGATKSLYSRMYIGDPRERLRDVQTYEELEKYLDKELCSWFNIEVLKGLRAALSIHDTDKSVRAYEELQKQYLARCCIYRTVDSHSEIVCQVPTDFRKVKDKQLNYYEYKLRQTIDMPECKRRVDEASGELVFEIKRSNMTAIVREELIKDTPLLGNSDHPRSCCTWNSKQKQVRSSLIHSLFLRLIFLMWLVVLVALSTVIPLYVHVLRSKPDTTVVYLYGEDVVLLATESDFYSIDFNEIMQQNRSQIDIYIGNPKLNVYNESIFKQGNVQPQSSVLVDREYLTPNSTLEIQLQPVNVNETKFRATIVIRSVQNRTYFETIITNTLKHNWTFNESEYYNIWINSSVQLNYTIKGEVYRYNASDLTLGCSIPTDQELCRLTRHELNVSDTDEVYIFGVASTSRDTITKLSYTTVDNAVDIGLLIGIAVNIVLIVIIIICHTVTVVV